MYVFRYCDIRPSSPQQQQGSAPHSARSKVLKQQTTKPKYTLFFSEPVFGTAGKNMAKAHTGGLSSVPFNEKTLR